MDSNRLKEWVKEASSLTTDSRDVEEDGLFFAIRGTKLDGHLYLPEVSKTAGVKIVGEDAPEKIGLDSSRYLQVPCSRAALSFAAGERYGNPTHDLGLQVVGVTGTSGKTTTVYLLESIFLASGKKVGVIGTNGNRINGKPMSQWGESTHTTPDPIDLQKILKAMKDESCHVVLMEVSSHGLEQSRVASVGFDGMIFTNLSPEHLDYHSDLEAYFQAKRKLFTEQAQFSFDLGKKPIAAIFEKDPHGQRLLRELSTAEFITVIPFKDTSSSIGLDGSRFSFLDQSIHCPLFGEFNARNAIGAATLAHRLGVSSSAICRGIEQMKSVPGRMEKVYHQPSVFVDYAHKPDALEKVLQLLKGLQSESSGKILTVFGCGGDRDREKRPVMGEIAARYSDRVYVTSDNPRSEDPDQIIAEILSGISEPLQNECVVVEPDRYRAIEKSLSEALPCDIVLIAGKGHEEFQKIGDQTLPFSDRQNAQSIMKSLDARVNRDDS